MKMKIIKNVLGWVIVIMLVVAIIVPFRQTFKRDKQSLALDMASMEQIANAAKSYVAIEHKLPPSDNAAFVYELSGQHDLLNPNKNAVLIMNGIIYDPWAKPYRFTLSEHSIRIDSSKQHYEESL